MRPQPRQHHVRGQADAQESAGVAARAFNALFVPPGGVLGQLECALQSGRVVATVVDHGCLSRFGAHVPREFVGADEVLAAHLGGVESEFLGEAIDDALGGKDRFGLACAAIGARGRLVCQRHAHTAAVGVEAIWPGQACCSKRWAQQPQAAGIRALI